MAEDTASVFKVIGLNDIYLFGASQGGMMALLIALEHPEMVRKLVLGSTAAAINEQMNKTVSEWIKLAQRGDASELYLAFGEKIYPEEINNASIDLLKTAGKAVTAEDLERFIIMAEAMNDYDIKERLKDIKCPTLILGARDDAVMGFQASEELTAIPDSRLYMYEGYGHAAFDTAPDYKERMYRFFC